MLLLVFSLLCLSDTWKLGLIVIRLFRVSELGCSYWCLTMSNWPGIFWHCLQRVLAKVWEVLLVAGPSISSLIVLKQTWKQGICYFQKWMSSNKARPQWIGFYQLPTIWLIVNLQWLSQGLCRTDHLSRMGAMQEASTSTRDPEDKTKTRHFHQVNIWLRKVNTSKFKVTCLSEQIFDNQ